MDANGTRFKLVLGVDDWARWSAPDGSVLADAWRRDPLGTETSWDETRKELTLARSPWRFPAAPDARALHLDDRRGAAMDRYGNWYSIDVDERAIAVLSSGSGAVTRFWPLAGDVQSVPAPTAVGFGPAATPRPACAEPLRGLAVTEDHYLVVGTLEPAGLLVFDLRSGGPPLHMLWPSAVPFAPFDIAARAGGGAFVLDRADGRASIVWRLDRHFRVEALRRGTPAALAEPATFAPAGGPSRTDPPAEPHLVSAADAMPLDGDPIAIDTAGNDLVIILDRRPADEAPALRLYDADMHELPGSPRLLSIRERPLVPHDFAVIESPAARTARTGDVVAEVFVVDAQGDQAYRFALTLGDLPLAVHQEYLPMRLFGGRALVGTSAGVFYDLGGRWIRLVPQQRAGFVATAVIVSPIFDSEEPGCVWHRVLIDGCLAPETALSVWSAAADEKETLDDPSWASEPSPYRRGDGPERPYIPWPRDPSYGTHELLLHGARGRFLRLRFELNGNRQQSPRLRALRAYYPRFSYVEQYLPGVYRADPGSASFLESFLANFEGFYTALEDRIAASEQLLDPNTAPAAALDWLASWFDIVLDPGWDDDRRRLLLRHAVELFRWRGTERGLRLALGLALLVCPDDRLFGPEAIADPGGIRIVEHFETKRLGAVLAGDPSASGLPRTAAVAARWTPHHGRAALDDHWARHVDELERRGVIDSDVADQGFPIARPDDEGLAPLWQAFAEAVLGFVPSATADDGPRWRAFLARRYVGVQELNRAHGRLGNAAYGRFEDVSVPTSLPADGPSLVDWYQFESVVMSGVRAAHQFSVLLPVPLGRATDGAVVRASDVRGRMADEERVARLVDLEKPAHTVFDVRSYWLAFRVGEARLGRDTLLDYGSRSPDLRPPAVLGSMHIGTGVLTSEMADLPDRPAVFT